jgi:hypothetical protein
MRAAALNVEIFGSMAKVAGKLTAWRQDYHQHRPHSSIGDLTPLAFAYRHTCGPSPPCRVGRLEGASVKGKSALDPVAPEPLLLRQEGEGPPCDGVICEG